MKADIQFAAVPFEEAAKIIANKDVVTREEWNGMVPELRARAFLITDIEDLNVAQEIRDIIAELPRGADWNSLKTEVEQKLLGPGGIPWLDEIGASKRATILLRHHGFQAYAAMNYRSMVAQTKTNPYWKYLTMGDENVRDEHAPLHGLILRADDPFWKDHFPPWDWGCRCIVIPQMEIDYINAIKANRVAGLMEIKNGAMVFDEMTQGWVLGPETATVLARDGKLNIGMGISIDVRSPLRKASEIIGAQNERRSAMRAAYQWNPGEMQIPVEQLKSRYDEKPWAEFEKKAKATIIESNPTRPSSSGTIKEQPENDPPETGSLWSWLTGGMLFFSQRRRAERLKREQEKKAKEKK